MSENNVNDNTINWREIGEQLRAPFNPNEVDFRPQLTKNSTAGSSAQAICYIDARTVADRLDEVVGPGAWSFTYTPLVIEHGQVQLAKGALAIHGVVKEDIGDASTFSESKGCVSDALKRAAVLWGIGRYLYSVDGAWITLDGHKGISEADVKRLRARLPRPDGAQAATPPPPPAAARNNTTSAAAAASEDEPATPEQQERMRKYREALRISDKVIAVTDNRLRRGEAEARISHYIEQWKQQQMRSATPAQNGARS